MPPASATSTPSVIPTQIIETSLPEGRLAFYEYPIGLFMIEANSLTQIADSSAMKLAPYLALSPTGGWIAFSEDTDGPGVTIYAMRLDNSQTIIVATQAMPYVSWSPDGERLMYSDTDANLHITSLDGGDSTFLRQIVSDPPVVVPPEQLRWSPGGRWIAFSFIYGTGFRTEVLLFNIESGEVTSLLPRAVQPTWSPDSQRIACLCPAEDRSNSDICVINIDGTGLTRLMSTPANEAWPSWSPSGQYIAYTSDNSDTGERELYFMNADGSNPIFLLAGDFLSLSWEGGN